MKNYLEHDIKVKYMDGILSHSQEWDWFIEYILNNYELEDVSCWNEFENDRRYLFEIYNCFIKIQSITNIASDSFENDLIKDLLTAAKLYLGQLSFKQGKERIKTNYGILLFLAVWITTIQATDNEDYLYTLDLRLFTYRNMWQISNTNAVSLVKEDILSEFSSITIDGCTDPMQCLIDNIECTLYDSRQDFLNRNKDSFVNVNAFSFKRLEEKYITWEEEYLGSMLSVSFENEGVQPSFSFGGNAFPDIALWSPEVLNLMKSFFSDTIADFVIDTVGFMLHGMKPGRNAIEQHCVLLADAINIMERYELVSCSSYCFMMKVFRDKSIKQTISGAEAFIKLIQSVQSIENADTILELKNDGFPLSKSQIATVNNYVVLQLEKLESINSSSELIPFLQDKEIPKHIDEVKMNCLANCFRHFIQNEQSVIRASVFYEYMVFLLRTNSTGVNIDKRLVQSEIINVQKLWEDTYYSKEVRSLQAISHETRIDREDIKKHNDIMINAPMAFARNCMMVDENDILSIMENASEHPIMHLVSAIDINPVYPKKIDGMNYHRNDIDKILREKVEKIQSEKGYRLMNQLDIDVYVKEVHSRQRMNLEIGMHLFHEIDFLFDEIQKYSQIDLVSVSDNKIVFANLSQLFPILEIVIRDLAKLTGYVPFKENIEEFMSFKDPSSILREIIQDVYSETKSFENIPDLLFVYHYMYNGNSMNIRNEAIHGRNYMTGSSLVVAYKTTLFSIYVLLKRIEIIKNNHNS